MQPRHTRALSIMNDAEKPMQLAEIFPGRVQNCMPTLIMRGWATAAEGAEVGFVITLAGRKALQQP